MFCIDFIWFVVKIHVLGIKTRLELNSTLSQSRIEFSNWIFKIWAQLDVWLLRKVFVGGWYNSRIESLQVLMTLDFGLGLGLGLWQLNVRRAMLNNSIESLGWHFQLLCWRAGCNNLMCLKVENGRNNSFSTFAGCLQEHNVSGERGLLNIHHLLPACRE